MMGTTKSCHHIMTKMSAYHATRNMLKSTFKAFKLKICHGLKVQRLHDIHAEKAPKQYETVWYIPHHGVYHPKKPEKLRVVFNCSADFQGHPLNCHLPQGPDLTNFLVSVLCRFRQEPVAIACDIVGMFHQVHVNEEHCDLLRFLWLEQGEYRMTVHQFGATSSPGCANLALRTAADDGVNEFGVEAASFIKENFFVDDGLKSVIVLIKNSTEMRMKGGFRLHKFTSNSKEVVKSTPIRSCASSRIQKAKGASPLSRLDPFLHHSNLVRVGGRIKQVSVYQNI